MRQTYSFYKSEEKKEVLFCLLFWETVQIQLAQGNPEFYIFFPHLQKAFNSNGYYSLRYCVAKCFLEIISFKSDSYPIRTTLITILIMCSESTVYSLNHYVILLQDGVGWRGGGEVAEPSHKSACTHFWGDDLCWTLYHRTHSLKC